MRRTILKTSLAAEQGTQSVLEVPQAQFHHPPVSVVDVKLLTVQEVADVLGVTARHVWRLASMGQIPDPVRLSERVVRWRLTDLVDFIRRL